MAKRVKSNLKAILEARDMSVRELSRLTGLPFESLRRLYTDETKQYQRDTIGRICEVLNIELSDLLILVDDDEPEKEGEI
ncbi:helix-turn-helix domain-containing protein [Geobacillus thermoleovorans]|uniref:helix-turn-helix domain-containing protein n=1 Tax=Geobacillus thermoleovorans TaxID=33941 RepID=UPI00205DD10F|nr:helix-turn-helix transcriptional regulator [Geobacillus thermoleovorans]UPT60484.1 helix-turn-helix domain-containing protein [Geobacillus thermoleovorans]